MVKGWDKERHEKDSSLLAEENIWRMKEGKAGRGTKCEWFLTDGNLGKIGKNEERMETTSLAKKKHNTSTNAYICDLENKANFSEAAFTTSYPYHCV